MFEMKKLENGFEYIEIKNSAASAKIALQGAHIFSFKRSDEELLWLSSESAFDNGSAIRGGIPICWPRFGNLDTSLPQHGFARIFLFELVSVSEESNMLTTVHMKLKSSKESRKIWDYAFELDILFYISETLKIEMKTTNSDEKEFLLTEAFHTYFKVSKITDVQIFGLENRHYIDTLIDKEVVQEGSIKIDKEVDRIYKESSSLIVLEDSDKKIHIEACNSNSVIVWNPWIEKCAKMNGMQKEGYKKFVCIESANALDDFKIVKPNKSVSISVEYSMLIKP
ncbi:D-hexose-6-phosphate mutarotase [Sulfurimonas sp.]|uniref:D-hexose-6-phosphate mutarotase n=1 Tax=Sulfurimonas sp. TaxID=2022749 RepID=UPI002609F129|nr:D-hexose-6-phosphate mutarotase [Sulfurimonas sp.]